MISKFKVKFLRQRFIRLKWLLLFLLALQVTVFGQEKQVTGKVTDASGAPLPGVNVVVKGTQIGTFTDNDGNYTISARPEDVLVFSSVGFIQEEYAVGSSTVINVSLDEEIIGVDEVVVIGYGTQKKSDLTGVIASVKAEDIQKIPVAGVAAALQGQATGVQVSQTTGAPGSSLQIRIRGISSINYVDPLWIVDGVPASSNSVNPADVESIEILKDASTAAIYGSNGANGVILVTTKKGKTGKPVANLNYYHGFQAVPNKIDVANGTQFGAMYTEMEALRKRTSFQFPNFQDLESYDYQDMIFRNADMDNIDFNVSGGNEKSNVYLGMGFLNQYGILRGTSQKRLNIRLNSNYQVANWLEFGENLAFTNNKISGFDEWQYLNEYTSPIIGAITVHPYLPPYDSTGNWVPRTVGNADSPLPSIELLNKARNNYEGTGTFRVLIKPFKGFSLESNITGSISFNDNYEFSPTYRFGSSLGQFNDISAITKGMGKYMSYNCQNLMKYNKTFFNKFNLFAMIGYEVGQSENMNMSGKRQYLLTEAPEMWYFDASTDDTTRSQIVDLRGSGSKSAGYSYFGRINFDYQGKYLLQFNVRKDYSSKFGPENRSGVFPGISLGWKFSEEDFIKNNLSFLSFGKIRYAYGISGINTIRDYAYFSTVSYQTTFSYSFTNSTTLASGAGPDVLVDKSIHWEQIITQNIGFDLAFFNNKLSLSVDKFSRKNVGMLVATTVPGYAGWTVRDTYQESGGIDSRPIVNIGNMLNRGWEFTAGYKSTFGKLKYAVSVNYSYVKNKADDLGSDSVRVGGTFKGLSGNICRTETGGNIADFYGFQVEKIFEESDARVLPNGKLLIVNQPYTIKANGDTAWAQPLAQPGDFKFVDRNNDGRITNDDMAPIGNPYPKHLLGISFNIEYGWFDLTMFWQGTFGNKIFNAVKFFGFNNDGQYNWNSDFIKDHYRLNDIVATDEYGNTIATFPRNISSKYPRLDPTNSNNNFSRISDFYVEDGSYLKLQNIQLGVTIPSKYTNRLSINQLRIYAGAYNLFVLTKYKGMDPEVPLNENLVAGIDRAAYPKARNIILGVNIRF